MASSGSWVLSLRSDKCIASVLTLGNSRFKLHISSEIQLTSGMQSQFHLHVPRSLFIDQCSRSETMYSAMASGYAPEHVRTIIQRGEAAISLARSAGDRIYEGFAQCYSLAYRLFCSEHCECWVASECAYLTMADSIGSCHVS